MTSGLIDAYRLSNGIALWTSAGRSVRRFTPRFSADDCPAARAALRRARYVPETRRTPFGERQVLTVDAPILGFERAVAAFERATDFRVALYDADLPPELQYVYRAGLRVGEHSLSELRFSYDGSLVVEGREVSLAGFARLFAERDPDVLVVVRAYEALPRLDAALRRAGFAVPFHRWDAQPLSYRGGRSFWRYGGVAYRDFSFRLHGRLLVDAHTLLGHACDVEALLEIARLAGSLPQLVASRSPGAAFQSALVRLLHEDGVLVPYKEKPLDPPVSLASLVKLDRAGQLLDPLPGVHRDVAEVDFASLFPALMVRENVSAEAVLAGGKPAPGIPAGVSHAVEGYVPRALKPFLEARARYKAQPTALNKRRAAGLKWVLVSSYGYLRFREFKLGLASSHAVTCAYARETLVESLHLAEERGFRVVHGIVDALYVQRPGITAGDARSLCAALGERFGVPVDFEGVFKWIVFLPSISDPARPLPHRYFGAYRDGGVKARGLEVRRRSSPRVVRAFQQAVLELLARYDADALRDALPEALRLFFRAKRGLASASGEALAVRLVLGRSSYDRDVPQRAVLAALKKRGVRRSPGQVVRFVHAASGVQLVEDYDGVPDVGRYCDLLERAFFVVVQPLGVGRDELGRLLRGQLSLHTWNWPSL